MAEILPMAYVKLHIFIWFLHAPSLSTLCSKLRVVFRINDRSTICWRFVYSRDNNVSFECRVPKLLACVFMNRLYSLNYYNQQWQFWFRTRTEFVENILNAFEQIKFQSQGEMETGKMFRIIYE